ncbi:cytochrome b [Ramlibacter sp. PS4R-6]|uniref:cytochrome b n=1 Tax=Ramlibacter sp. PS4R-6 TaxID=3133438 RepID=UPI0030B52861
MTLSGDRPHVSPAVAPYSRATVALHWLLAVLLIAQLVLGWWMVDLPKSPPGLRAGWFNVHKSIGIVLAVLVALRLAWRASHPAPAAHALPAWQLAAAQATHGALYACMLLMPVSGFLGSSFTRYPIRFFGAALPLPHADWPAAKQLMADFHLAAAYAFVVLVALHVAASAWHWLQHDGVAARMGIPSLR